MLRVGCDDVFNLCDRALDQNSDGAAHALITVAQMKIPDRPRPSHARRRPPVGAWAPGTTITAASWSRSTADQGFSRNARRMGAAEFPATSVALEFEGGADGACLNSLPAALLLRRPTWVRVPCAADDQLLTRRDRMRRSAAGLRWRSNLLLSVVIVFLAVSASNEPPCAVDFPMRSA